jgi:hypothetical protein
MKTLDAIKFVDQLYAECLADGTLKTYLADPYINYDRFKNFVMKHKGIDKGTIRSYREVMKAYKFLEFDELDRVFFIYKKSPDYRKPANTGLFNFMGGE